MLYANCNLFVTVQGGSSILGSYFGGVNIIYAVGGHEVNPKIDSYRNWYHEFSGAKIIPCNSHDKVLEAIEENAWSIKEIGI